MEFYFHGNNCSLQELDNKTIERGLIYACFKVVGISQIASKISIACWSSSL